MSCWVALLRGINVGGKHRLPMQELRDMLDRLGCEDVNTYIQSGNAVFRFSKDLQTLETDLTSAIDQACGFAPTVCLLQLDDYRAILDANPFPDAVSTPASLHVAFLAEKPGAPDLAKLNALQATTERFALLDGVFYLHAPDGIGRSKLAAKIDQCLGVATTGRNWRSAQAILKLAESIIS